MNKKQYRLTLIIFGVISLGLIATNYVWEYANWIFIFIGVTVFYIYIRYRLTGPLQMFSTKFNMLVDYDLDVEAALEMAQEHYDNAPNESIKALMQLYLGMALYYNAKYREAINMLNLIKLEKVNHLYHVLIFAFTGYAAFEEGDLELLDSCVSRLGEIKNRVNQKYYNFVVSYQEVLTAIKNLNVNPENYLEVIERNFSRNDGYISTKLIYNYRLAHYYKTMNNIEEMDKCLAKVIANGKNHHTAISAKMLFQNTCNIEDFVFPEPGTEPEEVEVVQDVEMIEQLEELEVVEETKIEEIEEEIEKTKEKE